METHMRVAGGDNVRCGSDTDYPDSFSFLRGAPQRTTYWFHICLPTLPAVTLLTSPPGDSRRLHHADVALQSSAPDTCLT